MFSKSLLLTLGLILFGNLVGPKNIYHKDYYANGTIKSEGWTNSHGRDGFWKFYHANGNKSEQGHYRHDIREKYWYFYRSNGSLKKEGHYKHGKSVNWWLYYDENGKVSHKCQLRNGKKNGYCLKYMDEKLSSAEKYSNGKKIKEWYSFRSFKKENNLSDLK
ncbi:toxin-antitoxin system YwqK family antitoxin [Spongiimicrobium sp. 3-5]|uniref:toxin-antitoxin system YwqK family antitoxin n=1 Tax=Spongiimicrobium sp. 3-5 TaxID=3332596 RepID=UPI00397F2476